MSLYARILRAVQNECINLASLNIHNVYRRKQPRLAEDEAVPAVTIHPGIEVEFEQHSENVVQFIYPVYLTLWQAGNGELQQNIDQLLDWREYARKHFHKRLPLPELESEIIDGEVSLSATFDPTLFSVNYDVSQLELLFLSEETRDDNETVA